MQDIYGGIEAGGTKFVCAVGNAPDQIIARETMPTTTPTETIGRVIAFFRPYAAQIAAYGVASFGPIDLHPTSPTFGMITTTPKMGWRQTDIVGAIRTAFGKPVGFDTDVNGAALGEYVWGAAQGLATFIYLTIGTGIGGGGLVNGEPMHGLLHPEMGHIRLPRSHDQDPFAGVCPYHGDCFEGLASGPAIAARWGQPATNLPPDHAAWQLEAHYIAAALVNYILTLSPQRIVLGGGVMAQPALLPRVREEVLGLLAGYVQSPAITDEIDRYIVPATHEGLIGVLGSFVLATRAHATAQ